MHELRLRPRAFYSLAEQQRAQQVANAVKYYARQSRLAGKPSRHSHPEV